MQFWFWVCVFLFLFCFVCLFVFGFCLFCCCCCCCCFCFRFVLFCFVLFCFGLIFAKYERKRLLKHSQEVSSWNYWIFWLGEKSKSRQVTTTPMGDGIPLWERLLIPNFGGGRGRQTRINLELSFVAYLISIYKLWHVPVLPTSSYGVKRGKFVDIDP